MSRLPRTMALTTVYEWQAGQSSPVQDYLAGEEPLQIRVNGAPLVVTMRTPGKDDLELATGFLVTEGLIRSRQDIVTLEHAEDCKPTERGNVVNVDLAAGVSLDFGTAQRNFNATSACGVCGKGSIETIRLRGIRRITSTLCVPPGVLSTLPERLHAAQTVFSRTGGLHAAGLFDPRGELIALREDIGRHNAVDKIIGWALLQDRLPLDNCILLVSGRGGFEIIQKAIVARIPILASVSAPSSLAVQMARELGLTLVGFLRGERFVVYSGEERLHPPVPGAATL